MRCPRCSGPMFEDFDDAENTFMCSMCGHRVTKVQERYEENTE